MADENLEIQISKFTWSNCEPFEANIFSSASSTESRESLDIKDYLQNEVVIKQSVDGIKGDFQGDELLASASSCSLTLFDDDGSLRTLFMIDSDTTLVKWRFRFLYDGVWERDMWLHPTDIQYTIKLDDVVCDIELYGEERDAREYLGELDLPDANTFQWVQQSGSVTIPNFNVMNWSDFLGQLLNTPVNVTGNWQILGGGGVSAGAGGQSAGGYAGARLYVPSSDKYYFFRNAYERQKSTGGKVYPFFREQCNCIGYVFYFEYANGRELTIRPRYDETLDTIDLHYFGNGASTGTDESGHIESKEQENIYDAIIIGNGRLYGGDGAFTPIFIRLDPSETVLVKGLKGETPIVIRDVEPNYRSEFFNRIDRLLATPYATLEGTGTFTLAGQVGFHLATFNFTGDMSLQVPFPVPTSGTVTGTVTGTIIETGTGGQATHTGSWEISLNGTIAETKSGGLTMTSLVGSFVNGSPSLINSTSGTMDVMGVLSPPNSLVILTLYFTTIEGYAYYKYGGEDDKTFRLLGYTNQEPFGGFRVLDALTSIKKDRILFVEGGGNVVHESKVNLGGGGMGLYHSENYGGTIEPGQSDLIFSGNAGSMLFRDNGTDLEDYTTYTESEEFKNNFKFFKKSETRRMTYTYDGVYSSLNKRVRFIEERGGEEIPFDERVWNIREIETNYSTETTQFNLAV